MTSLSSKSMPQVVITGDVTMDWNIACLRRTPGEAIGWVGEESSTRTFWQRGSVALLADLLIALARASKSTDTKFHVRQMAVPTEPVIPGDARFHHAYSLWSRFHQTIGANRQVWRMAEWLGFEESKVYPPESLWTCVIDDTPDADLVVIDDADLGFRHQPDRWPLVLDGDRRPWILLKMARPIAQGPLWDRLQRHYTERLIVITTINDLRQTEVQISRELSWERTAQDLAWELVYNPRINSLSRCAHVIVTFGAAGAMLISRQTASPSVTTQNMIQYRLIFDPNFIEGTWEQIHPGHITGATSCLTIALAHQMLRSPLQPDIEQAIQSGLAALRKLHEAGYGSQSALDPAEEAVRFPISLVVDEVMSQAKKFAVAQVQDPGRNLAQTISPSAAKLKPGLWTILEDLYAGSLDQVAQQIVVQGAEVALQGVPLGRFGALLTVDRQEIESFRSLRGSVGEYCHQANPRRPLSIAVFGTPGSGKSFGVTEVARSLLPGQIEKLEFNLSQFDSPHQLLDAFHRVRDLALSGRIPLVFWDEFDTALDNQPLGWLRHFLAPMQDGVFQEGQILHPLGRAIFVFAGGTSESMTTFDRGMADPFFRASKGPDFVSRLKGYVDIVGPNAKGGDHDADRYYIIRRAILLRQLLQRNAGQIFVWRDGIQSPQIDSGVLRAFLTIPAYKHGARSMESIVTTSTLAGKSHFERSALPTEMQLNLHVDGSQFLSLVQQIELSGELLETLAEAAHESYRGRAQAKDDDAVLARQTYAELSEEEKEQNRQTVRDIPSKLALAGYIMRPARSDEPPFNFPNGDREQLAELEHERWMQAMISAGWRHGPETKREQKLHNTLLPWHILAPQERKQRYNEVEEAAIGHEVLPENEKDKDRALIDGIPHILARAGYTLIKVREDGAYS